MGISDTMKYHQAMQRMKNAMGTNVSKSNA